MLLMSNEFQNFFSESWLNSKISMSLLQGLAIVTYRWFFVSGPISTNEVSFERASKAESNEVRMKSIRYLGAELQTFEN